MRDRSRIEVKKIDLDMGYCYLLKEEKPSLSYYLFERLTARSRGLCISRIYPQKLREDLDLRNHDVVWLSHMVGKDRCNPTALSSLAKIILLALEKNGIVLLDGLEYLVVQNGFNHALIFVEQINEVAMQNEGLVIIPINPKAFDVKELALLERNLKVVEGPSDLMEEDFSVLLESY